MVKKEIDIFRDKFSHRDAIRIDGRVENSIKEKANKGIISVDSNFREIT